MNALAMLTDVSLHLRLAGLLLAGLAVMGLFVPRKFGWARDAERMQPLNRQILYVHNAFIVLILAMFAAVSLLCTRALLEPGDVLARAVLGALTLFWFVRLLIQWFYYDRRLWIGRPFETSMHFLFTGVWIYFTATFGYALWLNLRA